MAVRTEQVIDHLGFIQVEVALITSCAQNFNNSIRTSQAKLQNVINIMGAAAREAVLGRDMPVDWVQLTADLSRLKSDSERYGKDFQRLKSVHQEGCEKMIAYVRAHQRTLGQYITAYVDREMVSLQDIVNAAERGIRQYDQKLVDVETFRAFKHDLAG